MAKKGVTVRVLAPKMEPKWNQNGYPKLSRRLPETLCKKNFDFLSLLSLFGLPLDSLWPPFWLLLAPFGLPFGSLWLALGSLLALWCSFGLLSAPLGLFWASSASHRQRRQKFGEILPRSCRDSAKNVPRICQQSAKNPPYEPQAKLPFTLRHLRNGFVCRQTLPQNRLE